MDGETNKIAFLGLGAMGSRMAARLLGAGHQLTVWNRSREKAEALAAKGAQVAPTPHSAAIGADLVISMVTDDAASRDVWMGADGALAGLGPGTLVAEVSTVSPGWIAELVQAATSKGAAFLDTPVAGSRPQAEAGELVFLAGGTDQAVARFEPLARCMGKAVLHAGPVGHGTVLKMIVNAMLAVQTATMAELLAYGAANGLKPDDTLRLLGPTPVMSPAAAMAGNLILQGRHEPMFTVDLLVKDLSYLLADTKSAPVSEAVLAAFKSAQTAGLGAHHITAIAEL